MAKKKKIVRIIPQKLLRKGFELSIQNAYNLSTSSMNLMNEYHQVALGLAQLGQEEIGKSFIILSAFNFKDSEFEWKEFWKLWKDHLIKSKIAYCYYYFNTYMIKIKDSTGKQLDGKSFRNKIPIEKEASFYVNYDAGKECFVGPEEDISLEETVNRIFQVNNLIHKANGIYNALEEDDSEFRYSAISEIVYKIYKKSYKLEEMSIVFKEFQNKSVRHNHLIQDLAKEFIKEKDLLKGMVDKIF